MDFEELDSAFAAREAMAAKLAEEGTDVYRLFHGENDGIPGVTIDRYGAASVITLYDGSQDVSEAELMTAAGEIGRRFGITAVYLKRFATDRSGSKPPDVLFEPRPFFGEAVAEEFRVRENGLCFGVRLYDGYSTGLFLDQRNNRRWLSETNQRGRLLNLFSYTCGFSVYAAKLGAETVNIDLSNRFLSWGKSNFQVNDLDLSRHRFYADDVRTYLRRAARRNERFDAIVVDPPTFARSKEGVFRIQSDLASVLDQVVPLLNPGGTLFASSNLAEWVWEEGDAIYFNRELRSLEGSLPSLPEDFGAPARPIWYCAWQKKS